MKTFLTFLEAQKIIDSQIKQSAIKEIDLLASVNHVLGQDVVSKIDLPVCDNSAMDGYAVCCEDIKEAKNYNPAKLKIIGSIFAGQTPKIALKKDQAARIMTGAPMPSGADTVIPVEETKEKDGSVFIYKQSPKGAHVRYKGEDIRKKEKALKKGKLIRPGEIAVLAALGYSKIEVVKTPQVAILATGDELVEINKKLAPGKIRNSNSYSLAAAAAECFSRPVLLGIGRDNPKELKAKIKKGLKYDCLIISGGISMGKSDFVGTVIKDLGVKIKFTKVLQRPGQPLTFGLFKSKPVFCLPGNPVSSLLSFEIYIRPALFKMMGIKGFARNKIMACIDEDIILKAGRTYFLRVKLIKKYDKYYASLTGPQGSGIMKSMVLMDGLLVVPDSIDLIKKGEVWPVTLM
jgi:molybdopterin molybdotransferase